MSRREKLIERMRSEPGGLRFGEVEALLKYEGFEAVKKKGSSHVRFRRADGRVLVIVRPHGRHTTCHPDDIRKILEAIER